MSEYCSEVYNYWATGDPELCTVSPATNNNNYPILWLIIVYVIKMFANLYGYVTDIEYDAVYVFNDYNTVTISRKQPQGEYYVKYQYY